MEIKCKIQQIVLQRVQKRVELSVLVGRMRAEPWAEGAAECEVQLVLLEHLKGMAGRRCTEPGTYVYLGSGRGYLTSPTIGTWRVANGVASAVEAPTDPHGSFTILHCVDKGTTAYIADRADYIVEYLNG